MTVTGTVQLEAWRQKLFPPVEQVRKGLWSIPVPIPIGHLRYVLVYAFEIPDGLALVDVGWDSNASWDVLVQGLEQTGHAVTDVRALLVTHVHRDHYGLAARLVAESGAWVGMHPREAATLPARFGEPEEVRDGLVAFLIDCGVPAAEALDMVPEAEAAAAMSRMPEPDRLLESDDVVPLPGWKLRALWTPGHTPGHLSFQEERHGLLLSGDHVLPKITPNISLNPRQGPDPLGSYLESLVAVGALSVEEVLPAHEYRFDGLQERAESLLDHHDERLEEIAQLVREVPESTAWEIAQRSTWARPWAQASPVIRRLAVGETQAHLVHLHNRGRLARRVQDGVAHWHDSAPD